MFSLALHIEAGNKGVKGVRIRAVFLGLRPSGREIGIGQTIDNRAADTALRTGRIFDAGVIFRTVSVPHFVTHVYHAK